MSDKKIIDNYSIGLDIGSNSVGWAVIDNNYSLISKSRKRLWGVRLFDEGQTAAQRRTFRTNRRRMERRRERIKLLRMLLSDLVLKDDPSFFVRLDSSFLHLGDEFGRKWRYNLFDDGQYTDKEYYRNNKTIYHLRSALLHEDRPFDPREIYLALHHIVKYRGHFLNEGDSADASGYRPDDIREYIAICKDRAENAEKFDSIDINDIENNLLGPDKRNVKVDNILRGISDKEIKTFIKAVCNAVLGMKFSLAAAINTDECIDADGKEIKFSFGDADYEEKEQGYIDSSGDNADLLGMLRNMYMGLKLKDILRGCEYLSDAMCDKYNQHKQDLKDIKGLFSDFASQADYKDVFYEKNRGNSVCYENYIHSIGKIPTKQNNRTPNELLIDKIFAILDKAKDRGIEQDERYIRLRETREMRELLPKLNSKDNSAVPYQVNLKELKKILENQGKYYPVLRENADKIGKILTFRRPYYVGVLKTESPFNWYDKKIDGKVYPWNFDEKVDLDYAQEKFIGALTNKCSIFKDEDVLPLHSFLYSEYMVLNELNKIKFRGELLDATVKQRLFEELFASQGAKTSVKQKDVAVFLKRYYNQSDITADDISGLAGEGQFNNIYKPCRDFRRVLGDAFDAGDIKSYEKAVFVLTVFSDEKARIRRLKNIFQSQLDGGKYTELNIKNLAKLKYSGWGRYSRKVLDGVQSFGEDGKTVIEIMRGTTRNFMEIRYNKAYGFDEQFTAQNSDGNSDIEELIRSSYCSPAVKKSIRETIKVVRELISITGSMPSRIYLEAADGEDEKKKGRAKSRVDRLIESYAKQCAEEKDESLKSILNELKLKSKNGEKLDEKLLLYYMQNCKSMYSQTPLELDRLNEYEVDHIIPRSLFYDDGFENKALVLKSENQKKAASVTLGKDIVDEMKPFWKKLLKYGLIGEKKYNALTRVEFKDEDVQGFINRQLVETRQSIKAVGDILKQVYGEDVEIVKIKAALSDQFKKQLGYYKIRELNDLHHAKDAYSAAVLGQFASATILCNERVFAEEYRHQMYLSARRDEVRTDNADNADKKNYKTDKNKHGAILNLMLFKSDYMLRQPGVCDSNGNPVKVCELVNKEGEIIWTERYLDCVRTTLSDNDCLLSKKKERRMNSDFYDQTIQSADKGDFPVKYYMTEDGVKKPLSPDIYGGYKSEKAAYAVVVKYEKGKKTKKETKELINVSVLAVESDSVDKYISERIGTSDYKIIKDHICKNQMLIYKGQLCYLASATELNNATQLYGNKEWENAVSNVVKANLNKKTAELDKIKGELKKFIEYYIAVLNDKFPLYRTTAQQVKTFYEQGGFDLLSDKEKQEFIIELLKVVSSKGVSSKLANFSVSKDGTTLKVGGSSHGRFNRPAFDVDAIEWIDRSVTGFYQTKSRS